MAELANFIAAAFAPARGPSDSSRLMSARPVVNEVITSDWSMSVSEFAGSIRSGMDGVAARQVIDTGGHLGRIGADVLRMVGAVDEDHPRPVRAGLFLGHRRVRDDDDQVTGADQPGRGAVDADHAAVSR